MPSSSKTGKLLSQLIAIPSVNPLLGPAPVSMAGEERIGRFVADLLRRAHLDVELMEVAPHRSNIIARLTPQAKVKQRLLLAPHLDTVGGDEKSLFTPRVRNGRLYGRGACDTKGSVAAMLSALLEVAGSAHRPSTTEIVFAGLVDEECHQAGSRALAASGLNADLAVVGEPTQLRVVTAHKGVMWLRLRTRGKAAHGARPELGRNAIHSMARVVECLQSTYAEQLRSQRPHPLLGRGSINVGAIQGGRQPNIVPAECWISIDRRTLPGEHPRTVAADIKRLLRRHGLRVEMESTQGGPCVALETDPQLPLVRQFMKAAGQKRPAGVDYFSDAAVLAGGGIPSVVWGPGDIAQAHTPDEWIDLHQLDHAQELLVCFLRTLP